MDIDFSVLNLKVSIQTLLSLCLICDSKNPSDHMNPQPITIWSGSKDLLQICSNISVAFGVPLICYVYPTPADFLQKVHVLRHDLNTIKEKHMHVQTFFYFTWRKVEEYWKMTLCAHGLSICEGGGQSKFCGTISFWCCPQIWKIPATVKIKLTKGVCLLFFIDITVPRTLKSSLSLP